MGRNPTDYEKRFRVAVLLSQPATRELPELEIARRAGCSKGLVNVVKRLLKGRPTRRG